MRFAALLSWALPSAAQNCVTFPIGGLPANFDITTRFLQNKCEWFSSSCETGQDMCQDMCVGTDTIAVRSKTMTCDVFGSNVVCDMTDCKDNGVFCGACYCVSRTDYPPFTDDDLLNPTVSSTYETYTLRKEFSDADCLAPSQLVKHDGSVSSSEACGEKTCARAWNTATGKELDCSSSIPGNVDSTSVCCDPVGCNWLNLRRVVQDQGIGAPNNNDFCAIPTTVANCNVQKCQSFCDAEPTCFSAASWFNPSTGAGACWLKAKKISSTAEPIECSSVYTSSFKTCNCPRGHNQELINSGESGDSVCSSIGTTCSMAWLDDLITTIACSSVTASPGSACCIPQTANPTLISNDPTVSPTVSPTAIPTFLPDTSHPSNYPTALPTSQPSSGGAISILVSFAPAVGPSFLATAAAASFLALV